MKQDDGPWDLPIYTAAQAERERAGRIKWDIARLQRAKEAGG